MSTSIAMPATAASLPAAVGCSSTVMFSPLRASLCAAKTQCIGSAADIMLQVYALRL